MGSETAIESLYTGLTPIYLHKGFMPSTGVFNEYEKGYEFGRRGGRGYQLRYLRGRPRCGRVSPRRNSGNPGDRHYGLFRNRLWPYGSVQSRQSVWCYWLDSGRGCNYRYPGRRVLHGPQRVSPVATNQYLNQIGRGAVLWA